MTEESLAERRGEVDATLETLDESVEDHEHRISRLEQFKQMAKGGLLVLALMAGSAIGVDAIDVILA